MAGKVLIVDDVSTNRIILKVKLAAACYQTVQAQNAREALELARSEQPDLALVDLALPDMNGTDLCRRLRDDPATAGIPIVVVTASTDVGTRLEALRAGASEVFSKPIDDLVLLARIRSLLRLREAARDHGMRDLSAEEFGFADEQGTFETPPRIALVAGRPENAFGWLKVLQSEVTERIAVIGPEDALVDWTESSVPDLFVISADLARKGDGLRLMSEIRSRHRTRNAAICIVLPDEARDIAAIALDLGANDLIDARSEPAEIAIRVRTQIEAKRKADRLRASVADGLKLAMTDPLTGLHNRRYALPHLTRIAAHAQMTGRIFAVMVMDLDRFKSINDTWGHSAGDAVLVEVAKRFRSNLRSVDLVARIGGEEFLVVLPDTTLEAARTTAERLRRVIEERSVRLPGGQGVTVTMSIGLAIGERGDGGLGATDALIARADQALMAAKAHGRNRVTVSLSAA